MSDQHRPDPCTIIIFGASGDLTRRKLLPALYHLKQTGLLPEKFAVVGVARRDMMATFAKDMQSAIVYADALAPDDAQLEDFIGHLSYLPVDFDTSADFTTLKTYLADLAQQHSLPANQLFYLSVAPEYFTGIVAQLGAHGMAQPAAADTWVRLVIEKPFGTDLATARQLNHAVGQVFKEEQVYRIDHYLGKEAVQNLLALRFQNRVFEPLWHHDHIAKIEITATESIGIGTRGEFYEKTGATRDILQNHLMEVLSLVCMEPPKALTAPQIRAQKLNLWQAIAPLSPDNAWRGQYGPGNVQNQDVPGYRQEEHVDPHSNVETYAALRLQINTPRWAGVPVLVRAGKRLNRQLTEVRITFKPLADQTAPNVLVIRIQPDAAISLHFNLKTPGATQVLTPATLDFNYAATFGSSLANGYERLLFDAMLGDATLFAHRDGVEATWALFTPLLQAWAAQVPTPPFPNYAAGADYPAESFGI